MTRPLRATLLAATLIGAAFGTAPPVLAQDATSCDAAGAEAEQRYGIPAGLLRAIGRIESGRRDPATGLVAPWPYTINAEARGHLFDSAAEALAATRALQATGVASIDVGCFQINLMHHPAAFATLEEGFSPAPNADYAARFLVTLRSKTGSWEAATAAYHSAVPERGLPYRDKVYALLSPGTIAASAPPRAMAAPVPMVVRMVTWAPLPSGGMRVWTPSAMGQGAAVIAMPGPGPRRIASR